MTDHRRSVRWIVIPLLLLSWGAFANDRPKGSFSFLLENDAVADTDGNYTGGISLTYESDNLDRYAPEHTLNRLTRWRRHLPGFQDDHRQRISIAGGAMAFTPADIREPIPNPDEPPYVGAFVIDTNLTSRDENDQHTYTLRMGWVGPSSRVGDLQEAIHDWMDDDKPRGWDHQVPDEPLINVGYAYTRRIAEGRLGGGLAWDVAPGVGVSAGNYFSGANVSIRARLGKNMTDNFGTTTVDSGVRGAHNVSEAPGSEWRYEVSVGVASMYIGHYLPLDGGLFKDGPDTDHKDVISVASFGVSIGKGNLQLDLLYNAWSETIDGTVPRSRYAGVNVTWFMDYQNDGA